MILRVVVALSMAGLAGCRGETPVQSYSAVPDFLLLDEQGNDAGASVFDGRVTVVDFIFTSCAGICPVMSHTMSGLQETFRDDDSVRFLSISVDPETDSPPVLRDYGSRYGANPEKWKFLTGQRDSIYSLTREGFKLGLELEADAILHSQKFVLVDGSRTIRGWYDSETELEQLKGDIRRLR